MKIYLIHDSSSNEVVAVFTDSKKAVEYLEIANTGTETTTYYLETYDSDTQNASIRYGVIITETVNEATGEVKVTEAIQMNSFLNCVTTAGIKTHASVSVHGNWLGKGYGSSYEEAESNLLATIEKAKAANLSWIVIN